MQRAAATSNTTPLIAALLAAAVACGPSLALGQTAAPAPAPVASPAPVAAPVAAPVTAAAVETGLAAVYNDSLNGRKTASGETYDRDKLTAAHKTLPFGTQVKVTNTKNKKSVVLRINDRGPVQAGRILDISPQAAKALGISPMGMAEVTAEVVGEAKARPKK